MPKLKLKETFTLWTGCTHPNSWRSSLKCCGKQINTSVSKNWLTLQYKLDCSVNLYAKKLFRNILQIYNYTWINICRMAPSSVNYSVYNCTIQYKLQFYRNIDNKKSNHSIDSWFRTWKYNFHFHNLFCQTSPMNMTLKMGQSQCQQIGMDV